MSSQKNCKVGVILAGGKGTRLAPLTKAIPKELLGVGGVPVIDYNINQMKVAGISEVFIVVGYRKESIVNYVGSGKRYGVNIAYIYQEEQQGPADAILYVEPFIDETFCIVFGDDYLEPPTALKKLIDYHLTHKGEGTIGVIPTEDARTTSIVKVDKNNRILDIVEKPNSMKFWSNLGSNGAHVFEPIVFEYIRKTPFGLNDEKYLSDTVRTMIKDSYIVYAFKNADLHLDIGVRERYLKANARAFSNSNSDNLNRLLEESNVT